MWSGRGWANQNPNSVRRKRCAEMRKLAKAFGPTVVLQHPHSTDTPKIWYGGWSGLRKDLGGVAAWASGIGYYRWDGVPRANLKSVLMKTRSDGCFDLTVDSR
jgi:hypothetical protein